jgi:hypothetical protein
MMWRLGTPQESVGFKNSARNKLQMSSESDSSQKGVQGRRRGINNGETDGYYEGSRILIVSLQVGHLNGTISVA